MDNLTHITTRLAVIMGLVTILIGAMTFVPHWLPASIATQPIDRTKAPLPVHPPTRQNAAADPLPTIAPPTTRPLPTIDVATTLTQLSQPFTITSAPQQRVGDEEQTPTDLVSRLAWHLGCLQPKMHHDMELDGQAQEKARRATARLPSQGAIQNAGVDAQRILLGPDQAALLEATSQRCGETLIFGVPPLYWLNGVRFGLGVDRRPDGVVIIVVTR